MKIFVGITTIILFYLGMVWILPFWVYKKDIKLYWFVELFMHLVFMGCFVIAMILIWSFRM